MLGSFSIQYRKLTWTIKNCNIQNLFILRTLAACFCCYYFNIFTTKFKEDIGRNFFFFVKCLKQIKVFTEINFRKNHFCVFYFRSCLKFNNFACIIFTGGKGQTFWRYLFIDFLWVHSSTPEFTCFFPRCKLNKRKI